MADIWDTELERRRGIQRARRTPPRVRLWDGNWDYRADLNDYSNLVVDWRHNAAGTLTITVPSTTSIASWIMRAEDRSTENVHITCDHNGTRWGGRLKKFTLTRSARGKNELKITFVHDYKELERIQVWSNPYLPDQIQFPREFVLFAPSKYVVKMALLLNLQRRFGGWITIGDLLDHTTWPALDPNAWPIVVKPNMGGDTTPLAFLHSRWKYWTECSEKILDDAQLTVECVRWLEGDPEPWPGFTPRNGTLVVDVVDRSGHWDASGAGTLGNTLTGIISTVGSLFGGIEEDRNPVTAPIPSEYTAINGKLHGTVPSAPWVVYRDGVNGVETVNYTRSPADAPVVTMGGKSPYGVNEAISSAIQMIGNNLGLAILQPTAGTVADTFLNPLYTDTIGAWQTFNAPRRKARAGWSHYQEYRASDSATAWSISGLAVAREAMWATATKSSVKISVADGAPYRIGANGEGHFFLGDRIGVTVDDISDTELFVLRVTRIVCKVSRKGMEYEITLGDTVNEDSPVDAILDKVRDVTGTLHNLGVI